MQQLLEKLAGLQSQFINFIRIAIFIVMAWIGGLKVCQYEADGIVPFVTNSPFMSFFYANSGKTAIDENGVTGEANKGKEVAQYKLHKNPEGKMVKANIEWHKENNTYIFSYGLGAFSFPSSIYWHYKALMDLSKTIFKSIRYVCNG